MFKKSRSAACSDAEGAPLEDQVEYSMSTTEKYMSPVSPVALRFFLFVDCPHDGFPTVPFLIIYSFPDHKYLHYFRPGLKGYPDPGFPYQGINIRVKKELIWMFLGF